MRLRYEPNPTHKRVPSEAGPPRWYSEKTPCPDEIGSLEIEDLLARSRSESGNPLDPVRFAFRRADGKIEWFTTRLTQKLPDGTIIVHGFPRNRRENPHQPPIPTRVLRAMRDAGELTPAEYKESLEL